MAMLEDSYHPHVFHPGDPIAPAKTWWIWKVFWILLAVTSVEVTLAFMNFYNTWGVDKDTHHTITKVLKWVYILLTLVKAGYIIFSYMHLKDEKRSFKLTLGFLVIVLCYFVTLLMIEGYYQDIIHYDYPLFMQSDPEGAVAH